MQIIQEKRNKLFTLNTVIFYKNSSFQDNPGLNCAPRSSTFELRRSGSSSIHINHPCSPVAPPSLTTLSFAIIFTDLKQPMVDIISLSAISLLRWVPRSTLLLWPRIFKYVAIRTRSRILEMNVEQQNARLNALDNKIDELASHILPSSPMN